MAAPEGGRVAETRRTSAIIAVMCLSGTVAALQQTIMVPLLPELPRLLHTTPADASWILTATLVSAAVSTPVVTRLADLYGKRLMLVTALALMVLGAVVGSLAVNLPLAVVSRALQGCGMALIPIAIAVMHEELPPHRAPLGVALMSATLAIGAGVGMPLAGLILRYLDWHAVFWVTGIGSAVMLVLTRLVLRESPHRPGGNFDWLGAIVLSIAITAILLALSKASTWGITDLRTIGLVVLGVLVLAVWAPMQLRHAQPLVDLRVNSRPAVLFINIASVLIGFAMYANMLTTTLFLQSPEQTGYGFHLSVFHAGLWQAPGAIVFGLLAPVATWITNRFGARTTLLVGSLVMGLGGFGRVLLSHSVIQVVGSSLIVAAGTSLTYAAMPTLMMASVPITQTSSANGLNTLLRSVGTSSFSAFLATVTAATAIQLPGGSTAPSLTGLISTLIASGTAALVAAGLVLLLWKVAPEAR
ncbi:MFS transporter [Naumannella sp. ID2617S]|nr:MFS transporter [Naumannella sp. ID2617S]